MVKAGLAPTCDGFLCCQDGATKILHNHLRSASGQESEPLSPRNVTSPTTNPMPRYKASANRSAMDELETENMNPEEIYNSIKKATADIQNLSKLDGQYDDVKKERDCTSQDSGIQSSMHDVRGDSPETKGSMDTTDSPQRQRQQQYNPSYYQDDVSASPSQYSVVTCPPAVWPPIIQWLAEQF